MKPHARLAVALLAIASLATAARRDAVFVSRARLLRRRDAPRSEVKRERSGDKAES